jgi:hypothetical protein
LESLTISQTSDSACSIKLLPNYLQHSLDLAVVG